MRINGKVNDSKKSLLCKSLLIIVIAALMFAVSCSDQVYYNAYFYTNGGTSVPSQQVKKGDYVQIPFTPKKEGYSFAGWYANSLLTIPYLFNEPVTKETLIYAKWSESGSGATDDNTLKTGGGWFDAFSTWDSSITKSNVIKIVFTDTVPAVYTEGPIQGMCVNDLSKEVVGYYEKVVDNYILYIVGEKIYGGKDCSYMFDGFGNLTSVDLDNFDTSNVTSMKGMFFGYDYNTFDYCSSLESINFGSDFDTSNVTNMGLMFYGCKSLTSLDVSSFKTSKVTEMGNMFSGCSSLTSLNVSSLNTSNVTSMTYMFLDCSELTSLNVSGFNTSNVTGMGDMFCRCSSLTSLNVSSFNTSSVTEMDRMFYNCSELTSITFGSDFDTSNVTNMGAMFYGCESLTSLNVSSFDTSNVTSMAYMFSNCPNLATIYAASGADWSNSSAASTDMFDNCTLLVGGNGTKYDSNYVDKTYARADGGAGDEGYFTAPPDPYTLKKQDTWFEAFSSAGKTKSEITQVVFAKSLPSGLSSQIGPVDVSGSGYTGTDTSKGVVGYYGEKTVGSTTEKMIYIIGKTIKGNPDSSYMFMANLEETKSNSQPDFFMNLKSIDFGNFDTSGIKNMSYMFSYCYGLASLDLSKLDTSNVTDMNNMFCACKELTSLNLSGLDTSKVTDMSSMFSSCEKLTSLDFSNFNTSEVTDMSSMFYGCSGLASLDLSSFDASEVTDMGNMFRECVKLASITFGNNFNTSNVTSMSSMFCECISLNNLNLSSFDTSEVVEMSNMFSYCKALTSLDVSNFDTTKVTGMLGMFSNCKKLTSIDLSEWNRSTAGDTSNTSAVTDMSNMFSGCESVSSITFGSNFSTSNVTDMSKMFSGCSGLTSLDLSSFNTSNTGKMGYMFAGCYKDVNNNGVVDAGDTGLTSVVFGQGWTGGSGEYGYMFSGCKKLTTLTGFKAASEMYYLFDGCSSLVTLDVSGFAPYKMDCMFRNCSSLTTIYAASGSDWSGIGMPTEGSGMFDGCTLLVGGSGTIYNSGNTGKAYAHIDGGASTPGYFTVKAN